MKLTYYKIRAQSLIVAVAYAGKNFGGFKFMAGLVGGPGEEPPPGRRRIFENLKKNFLRKLAKNTLFLGYFSKEI